MKIIKLSWLLITLLLCISCNDDDEFRSAATTPVEALYSPEDNAFFNLDAENSVIFEWQRARSEDNGVVLYEVVLDLADGDFSDPVFVTPSDGDGFQNTLTLSYNELNRIAGFAGIEPEATASMQWTVRTSKGVNVQASEVKRSFEVKRAGGFPSPDQLFLTGDASETGTDLASARSFKRTGADSFEIYTSLQEGSYQLVTNTSGNGEVFYVNENNKLQMDGETVITGEEQVYRIRVDFSDGSVAVSTIDAVEFWFPTYGEFPFALNYAGNGTWEALDEYIEFNEVSYGREERYKFRFTVTSGGNTAAEWYGSTNADNQRPTADSPASYYYMVPAPDDEYTNTFKFATEVDQSTINMRIIFNPEVEEYTHVIEII